jgi:hypothetical protein
MTVVTINRPDTAALLDSCEKWARRYVVLSAEQCTVIAAWILHTWAIDAAECTPYLHITAPEKGCGKSRLLETLEPVVCRPCKTGGMSAAALVRTVDAESPTLLLDEFDAALGSDKEYSEALRGILNEGFRRGGNFRKVEGKNHQLRVFQVFGAKAIAGIGRIPDTVASRSIVIEMRRKTPAESVEPFRQREVRAASRPLAESLQAWASSERLYLLREARPLLPHELNDRQKDITEPLLAIADLAGGEWPKRLRQALVVLFGSTASDDDSIGVMLLRDIRSIFEECEGGGPKQKGMHSADLAAALCQLEGRPWAEWAKGRGMDANRLAKQLKKYGISPQSIRLDGGNQKGYWRDSFLDAWVRYCLPSASSATLAVTAVTTRMDTDQTHASRPVTQPSPDHAAVTREPASTQGCDAVTPVTALAGREKHDALMFEGEL